jgi:hypothetical protein
MATDESAIAGGYFPLEFAFDFLRFLREHDDVIEIITYEDLPWGDDVNYERSYPSEWKVWKKELRQGERDADKIYVLLQHDVDSVPERTIRLLREEEALRLPSNVMIFRERVNRRYLVRTGKLRLTGYDVDHDLLSRLESDHRFVIAYHSNTYERAGFDYAKATELIAEDVAALRERFRISFFSPHGGPPGPDGNSNNAVEPPASLKDSLRWVANRYTVRFDGMYSDGGINSPKRDPAGRDLRDFVRTWRRGGRYRVLLHPQYYHSPTQSSPRMQGTPWYDELLRNPVGSWNDVRLPT